MIVLIRSEQGGLYWHKSRDHSKRIASSDLAAVLYMHRYKSRNQLLKEKRDPFHKRKNQETPATQHGRFWEQFALGKVSLMFPESAGWKLLRPGSILDFVYPLSCSPDMMVTREDEFHDELIGVETKCPYSAPIPMKKEDIPSEYLLQAFSCLMITGADRWVLSFYQSSTDTLTSYEIAPDSDLWHSLIVPRVSQFLEEVRASSAATSERPFRKGKKEKEQEKLIRERLLDVTERSLF